MFHRGGVEHAESAVRKKQLCTLAFVISNEVRDPA
jgi:hypothetical protein